VIQTIPLAKAKKSQQPKTQQYMVSVFEDRRIPIMKDNHRNFSMDLEKGGGGFIAFQISQERAPRSGLLVRVSIRILGTP
jgi:hypothetical protein